MSLTRDPIFKSIMFALLVGYIGLISQSVWAAKGGKPLPEPQPGQFALVDADGQLIGDATISNDTSDVAVVFLINEIQYAAWVSPKGFYSSGLQYDEMGCMGNAYADVAQNRFMRLLTGLRSGVLFVGGPPLGEVTFYSWWESTEEGGICHDHNTPFTDTGWGLAEPIVDTVIYKKPFQLKYFSGN